MNLFKITWKYLLRPWFEYLRFRRIWQILVEAKQLELFVFFTICGSKSNNYLENGPIFFDIWLNDIQYSLQYSLWGWILRPQTINFLLSLLFDLGYRDLRLASTTNLKVGPHLARILTWVILTSNVTCQKSGHMSLWFLSSTKIELNGHLALS